MFSFLQSIISKLATSAMSIFYLASIAEETGSSLPLLETLKTDFVLPPKAEMVMGRNVQ